MSTTLVRTGSMILGIILIILGLVGVGAGLFLLSIPLLGAIGTILLLLGVVFLAGATLLIYHALKRTSSLTQFYGSVNQPQHTPASPIQPPPIQPAQPSTIVGARPVFPTQHVLATLRSPRGNLLITQQEQEFGRENFTSILSATELNTISRRHFKISLIGGRLYVMDLGSTNGTFINGQDIRGKGLVELRPGDKLNIANVIEFTW